MKEVVKTLQSADWDAIRKNIDVRGYELIKSVLPRDECMKLISLYDQPHLFRKTVDMGRYRFGKGEYKYFSYPLPVLIDEIRKNVYSHLVILANDWMEKLNTGFRFPLDHDSFLRECHKHGQAKPTALILKYGVGGFNTLHQDLYGSVYFPFQIVLFLNEPGKDYVGGEFVLCEQIPRAQSKAMVVNAGLGDVLVFTTNFRPAQGTRGFYRVTMKHGVSEIQRGERHTLGIIFHDGAT